MNETWYKSFTATPNQGLRLAKVDPGECVSEKIADNKNGSVEANNWDPWRRHKRFGFRPSSVAAPFSPFSANSECFFFLSCFLCYASF